MIGCRAGRPFFVADAGRLTTPAFKSKLSAVSVASSPALAANVKGYLSQVGFPAPLIRGDSGNGRENRVNGKMIYRTPIDLHRDERAQRAGKVLIWISPNTKSS
jgi:hypothetical protein